MNEYKLNSTKGWKGVCVTQESSTWQTQVLPSGGKHVTSGENGESLFSHLILHRISQEDLDGRGDLSNASWSLSMSLAASPSVVALLTRLEALTIGQLFKNPCGGKKSGS